MSIHAFTAFILYPLINAFTPGPGNILALNTVANYGLVKGHNLFLGIFSGYYVVQISCAIFIFGLNEMLNPFMSIMKYIGTIYILYLAIHIAASKPIENEKQESASFCKGFLLQSSGHQSHFSCSIA
jgi:cysteine/O-acetylserine efflux protein